MAFFDEEERKKKIFVFGRGGRGLLCPILGWSDSLDHPRGDYAAWKLDSLFSYRVGNGVVLTLDWDLTS